MSLNRAVVSVAAIFLGVSAAVAQQPETAPAVSASTLTNPPVFQGLMVDAKGKTVGRLFIPAPPIIVPSGSNYVVRQINKIWVLLPVFDFTTGFFQTVAPSFVYQSADCTGSAFMWANPGAVDPVTGGVALTGPAIGMVTTIPPATAPSIYFSGSLRSLTINSIRFAGSPCSPFSGGNPNYVGPV
jgi:hypothetical protein